SRSVGLGQVLRVVLLQLLATGTILIGTSSPASASVPLTGTGIDLCAEAGFNAGWHGQLLVTAVAVCYAESSGNPTIYNGSCCYGLWQVNPSNGYTVSCLTQAQCNANAAYAIYNRNSSWCDWEVWSGAGCKPGSYNDNYAKWLVQATAAVDNILIN